jgi:hypothetical protein
MQFVTAALLSVYFLFVLNHIVANEGFFERLNAFKLSFFDTLALVFVVVVLAYYLTRSRFAKGSGLDEPMSFG